MENVLLNPDLLRVAKLSAAEAQELLFEAPGEEGGEPTLKADAPSLIARRILDRMEQERKDKLGQGIKTHAQKVEAAISPLFQAFGVQSDDVVSGITGLAEKIELLRKEKPSLADLTDDEIVKLPAFQRKLNAELVAAREERERLQKQHEEFVLQVERQKVDNVVFGHVESALSKANASFAPNRAAQLRHFFNALDRSYFHLNDDGTIDLLDKDGIALRGPNKEMVTFEEYVVDKWRNEFGGGIKEADPAPPTPGKPGTPGSFTTSAQVQEALNREKDPARKRELMRTLAELIGKGK